MKRNLLLLAVMVMATLFFNSQSWAECDDTHPGIDLGICDTLYVETFDCDHLYDTTGTYDSVRVALYVTHDSNTFWWDNDQCDPPNPGCWVQDSIAGFVIPLKFWKEGDADSVVFAGKSPYNTGWNNKSMDETDNAKFPRSMFRHLYNPHTGVTDSNRFTIQVDSGWTAWTISMDVERKAPGHVFLSMMPISSGCQRWPEGSRVLFATYTFLVYMHPGGKWAKIDFDSTFWPPSGHLRFFRHDSPQYTPRHFLPVCDSIFISENQAPHPFSLLFPPNKAFTPRRVRFDWETATDPNPSDSVRYDLYVSTSYRFPPDSTTIDANLVASEHMKILNYGAYYWKVKAKDNYGGERWSNQIGYFMVTGIHYSGDVNGDGFIDIGDVVFLINYLYTSGPASDPLELGDVNCDGVINVADVVYLINYLFIGGPSPC